MAEAPVRAGPTQVGTSAGTIYTAPATGWCILRSIHVVNEDDMTTAKLTVGINTTATDAAGKRIVRSHPILADDEQDIPVRGGPLLFIPLNNNDVVYALSDQSNLLTITLGIVTGP